MQDADSRPTAAIVVLPTLLGMEPSVGDNNSISELVSGCARVTKRAQRVVMALEVMYCPAIHIIHASHVQPIKANTSIQPKRPRSCNLIQSHHKAPVNLLKAHTPTTTTTSLPRPLRPPSPPPILITLPRLVPLPRRITAQSTLRTRLLLLLSLRQVQLTWLLA